MDQFEYFVREYHLKDRMRYEQDLQVAGRDGWELVSVIPLATNAMLAGATTDIQATFKRRIPPQAQYAPPHQQQRVS